MPQADSMYTRPRFLSSTVGVKGLVVCFGFFLPPKQTIILKTNVVTFKSLQNFMF